MFADRHQRPSAALVAVGTALAFAALSGLTGGFVVLPAFGPADIAVGLALPLGLCLGTPVALGVGGGVVLTAALEATLSWLTLLDAIAYGAVAVVGPSLWGTLPRVTGGRPPGLRSPGQLLELVAVTVIAATITATILAWGAVLSRTGPFHAVALPELGIVIRSTLVVGIPMLPIVSPVERVSARYTNRRELTVRVGALWGGVVVPPVWVLFGTASSILLDSRPLQIVGGTFAVSMIAATYLSLEWRPASHPPREPAKP